MPRNAAAVLLVMLAVPSVALVTRGGTAPAPNPPPAPAPKKHPADATTIDGVDCNHAKSIIAKWTKSTRVGRLLGAAKAASDAANQAATNADAAADAAEQVGLKIGNSAPKGSCGPSNAPYNTSALTKVCSFENGPDCNNWVNAPSGDNFNWRRHSLKTGSTHTGPLKAHSGTFYLYIETSVPRYKDENAKLERIADLGEGAYLEFEYNMYGVDIGTLNVKANGQTVWNMTGAQTNAATWKTAKVDLSGHMGLATKIEFEGTVGGNRTRASRYGKSYDGDISIDLIKLYLGHSCAGTVIPSSVGDAVIVARNASTDAAAKALTLATTIGSIKTAMGTTSFGEDVSNAMITQIITETEDVIVATADVKESSTRATRKTKEAKEAALKNTKAALRMIKAVLSDIATLTKQVQAMEQRIGFSTKDVNTSLGTADVTSTFMTRGLGTYISVHAAEQAPVWQAHFDALVTLATTLTTAMNAVNDETIGKLGIMKTALGNVTAEEITLKGVVDAAQSSESAALGQAENIAKAEETIRTATTAMDACKNAVLTMMMSKKRLDDKYVDVVKRLKAAPKSTCAPPPKSTGAPSPKGKFCSFETNERKYCGLWSDAASGDIFNWRHHRFKTGSTHTGPLQAHSGNYYLYIETSVPRYKDDNAKLETVTGVLGEGSYLEFEYNMYGVDIGTLNVKANGQTVWNMTGAQTNAATWKTAKVDLNGYKGSAPKLEFEGIAGGNRTRANSRGKGYDGDIAIDAVTLYEGVDPCALPEILR